MVWRRGARVHSHLFLLIACIVAVPLGLLVWLAAKLLAQDDLLLRHQTQQRLERGADIVVSALDGALARTAQELATGRTTWPAGAVVVRLDTSSVEAIPRGGVAFVPAVARPAEPPADRFMSAETIEFAGLGTDAALAAYRRLAQSSDTGIQAGALFRTARVLQNAGRTEDALRVYEQLVDRDDVGVAGVPMSLAVRYARCRLLEKTGRASELRDEASLLEADLENGRWSVAGPIYWLYVGDARRWTGAPSVPARPSEAMAEALAAVWEQWAAGAPVQSSAPRRQALHMDSVDVVALAQPSAAGVTILLADDKFVQHEWLSAARGDIEAHRLHISLLGRGSAPPNREAEAPTAVRLAADTSLPWTVVATSVEPVPEAEEFAGRRRLLLTGMALVVLIASAAAYVLIRGLTREAAVARMQSDFVSAVSHEFRTPLTALRQFNEMLRDNRKVDEERRRLAYDAQARAIERLMRLVESLLDFGRMEAGAHRYSFQPRDCGAVVRAVVNEMATELGTAGPPINCDLTGAIPVSIDVDALSRALRNLIDNAVKYSPNRDPIHVNVRQQGAEARIAVSDRGMGISAREQSTIFRKFQRGDQARIRGIKGTGIGLALVAEIVRAHGGRIDLVSIPGAGSTFTIVLPVIALARPHTVPLDTQLSWPES